MAEIPGVASVGRVSTETLLLPALRAPANKAPEALAGSAAAVTDAALQAQDRIDKAAEKVRSREDTLQRVRDRSAFNEFATGQFQSMETEQDISDPDTLKTFGLELQKSMEATSAAHRGSDESRVRLQAELEAARSAFVTRAATMVNKQQRALIENDFATRTTAISSAVDSSVEGVLAGFSRVDDVLDDLSPGMDADKEEDNRRAARSSIVKSAVTPLLDTSTEEGALIAESIIARPEIIESLDAESLRKIRSRITVVRSKAAKGRIAGQQALEKAATIAGVEVDDLTPDQRLSLAGLSDNTQTLSEKISAFQAAMGPDFVVTQDHIEKLAGAFAPEDNMFGSGLTGRALAIMTDDATPFAHGTLTQEQENRFVSAVVEYQQETTFQNSDTGLPESRHRELPPFVQEALRRRGMDQLIRPPRQQGPVTQEQPDQVSQAGTETIFDLAGDITGPIPSAVEGLSRVPVIGEFVDAGRFTSARQKVGIMTRDLVRVLANSPKFAEGERAAIQKDVDLTGSVIDTPKAFRDRLIGMDDALAVRQANAFRTAQSGLVSREERQHSMNVLNALTAFREQLGVPPLVKTPDEARKLPSKTKFRDPDGVVRQVP